MMEASTNQFFEERKRTRRFFNRMSPRYPIVERHLFPEYRQALGAAMAALRWLGEGWGYEVTSGDVVEAYDRAMDAANRLNNTDDVNDQIRQLVESKESASMQFVRQSLLRRLHPPTRPLRPSKRSSKRPCWRTTRPHLLPGVQRERSA